MEWALSVAASLFTSVNWPTVVSTILGTGLVIPLGNRFLDRRRRLEGVRQRITIVGFSFAEIFESYAIDCAYSLRSQLIYESVDGYAGHLMEDIPVLQALPKSDDLKLLDANLIDAVRGFRQFYENCRRFASDESDFNGPENVGNALEIAAIRSGYKALTVAKEIRHSCRLPQRELVIGTTSVRALFEKEAILWPHLDWEFLEKIDK